MKIILHLDMNSYFATVEQQANPFWRGKPVGVCAYLSANGCIIASSVEAKELGIKTGCLVREAKKIYPDIILVENQPDKYRWVTSQIFRILRHYSDAVEPYSIDEAFIDLTGYTDNFLVAQKIALQIQRRIKDEVGEWLRCSMGLAYTRYLAKLASDLAPVDGLKVIAKDSLEQTLAGLELTQAWGINRRLARRLQALGINTLLELKNYPPANLLTVMGKPGYYLWANLNGQELEKVESERPQRLKSVGHSYCLPKKEPNLRYFSQVYMKLCEKTGRRLRALNKEAHTIMVSWAYDAGGGYYKLVKVFPPLYDSWEIYQKTWGIFTTYYNNEPVRFLAVSVTNLLPLSGQLELFNKDEKIKQREIVKAMDEINNHYGEYAVIRGAMFGTQDSARDRIGFRKTIPTEFQADQDIAYETTQSF